MEIGNKGGYFALCDEYSSVANRNHLSKPCCSKCGVGGERGFLGFRIASKSLNSISEFGRLLFMPYVLHKEICSSHAI